MRLQHGFTLVELMVTIAILGILLALGLPLTSAWIDRSKVDNAAASLKTAIFDARVNALRNPNNRSNNVVATRVCIAADNEINVVLLANPVPCAANKEAEETNGNTVLKSTPFANDITFNQAGIPIIGNCFAFSSNGMLNTTGCAANLNTITVEKNDETADVNIL